MKYMVLYSFFLRDANADIRIASTNKAQKPVRRPGWCFSSIGDSPTQLGWNSLFRMKRIRKSKRLSETRSPVHSAVFRMRGRDHPVTSPHKP